MLKRRTGGIVADTLDMAAKLEESGFERRQAEGVTRATPRT